MRWSCKCRCCWINNNAGLTPSDSNNRSLTLLHIFIKAPYKCQNHNFSGETALSVNCQRLDLTNKMFIFMFFIHWCCIKNSKFIWHNQPWNKWSEGPRLCSSAATELTGTFLSQGAYHPAGLIFGRSFWVLIINMSIFPFLHKTFSCVSHLWLSDQKHLWLFISKASWNPVRTLTMTDCIRTWLMQNYSLYLQ